jgi:hypothetical protein
MHIDVSQRRTYPGAWNAAWLDLVSKLADAADHGADFRVCRAKGYLMRLRQRRPNGRRSGEAAPEDCAGEPVLAAALIGRTAKKLLSIARGNLRKA